MTARPVTGGHADRRAARLLILAFLLVHGAAALLIALRSPYPASLDERQHVSYVLHVKTHGDLVPDPARMHVLNDGPTPGFAAELNYLQHPSFYYWLLSPFADAAVDARTNAARLRLVNLAVSLAAVAVILAAGMALLGDPTARLAFAATVVLCPKVMVVAGMVNNDNLALLGGGLAFWGLGLMARDGPGPRTGLLIGGGLALAGLAKLTGALTVGFLVVFAHALLWSEWRRADARNLGTHLAAGIGLGMIGAQPYLANLVVFGAPLPQAAHLWALNLGPKIVGPLTFFVYFMKRFARSWSVFRSDPLAVAALLLVVGMAMATARRWRRTMAAVSPAPVLAAAGLAAVVAVLAVDFAVVYRVHLTNGFASGVTMRYLLPLWPAIALGAAGAVAEARPARVQGALLALLAGLLVWSHTVPLIVDALAGT